MKTTEFLRYLNDRVSHYRQSFRLNEGKAFGMWYATEGLEFEDAEAYEAVSYDRGNDKDIDFFHVDQDAERILIGQLKFNSKGRFKGTKGGLFGLVHTTDWLRDTEALKREGLTELAKASEDYIDAVEKGFSVEYLYIYCGPPNREVSDAAAQFNLSEAGSIPAKSCRIENIDSLITTHQEAIDQSTRIVTAELTLNENSWYEERGAFGKAIVASLPGNQLRALYDKHGDRLFDRNVRLFLGAKKGSVNAAIRDTLDSPQERKNFWAYNNGVAFICDRYELEDSKIHLHNFSIVNGCQTTISLSRSVSDASRDVKVLVRFIATPEKTVDSIIQYTNSQNRIRPWDINVQDKLQRRLKKELANLPQPFLYVLRKGETRQLTQKERGKFRRDGKMLMIRHDLNGQYLAAFKGLPAIAYKDKGKIFTGFKDKVFPPQIRTEEVVIAWQAGSIARDLVKKELEEAANNEDEQRVSILKRGATFFVLAVMGNILHLRNGSTFLNRLKPEVAVSKATEARLKNYATVALEWYVDIMSELVVADVEISSIVRTQEGWRKIFSKLQGKWKIFSLAKKAMEETLPKL